MMNILFICCRRSSIIIRSEQLSYAFKMCRMIDEGIVINFAQNCSVAWLFYS
jgi:hypothetical protein